MPFEDPEEVLSKEAILSNEMYNNQLRPKTLEVK